MSEPRTVHNRSRDLGNRMRKVARAVENGGGTYHISMELFNGDRIAATGATHLYPGSEEELAEQWKWALRWLKDDYPRLMPEHKQAKGEE